MIVAGVVYPETVSPQGSAAVGYTATFASVPKQWTLTFPQPGCTVLGFVFSPINPTSNSSSALDPVSIIPATSPNNTATFTGNTVVINIKGLDEGFSFITVLCCPVM